MKMEWRRLELHPEVYDPETGETRPGVPRCLVAFNKNGDERMLYFPGEAGGILRDMAGHRGMSPYVFDLVGPLRRCPGSGAQTPYGYPGGCETCFAVFPERKLKAIPDGDGTVLDHMLIYKGSNMGNSHRHAHQKVPVILVGGIDGTFKGNRHLVFPDNTQRTSNMLLSLLHLYGIEQDKIGTSTGPLTPLEIA